MFKKIITAVFLCISFCVLVSLGVWQLQRLEWKKGILDAIAQQESIDPMTMKLDLSRDENFQRGYMQGRFLDKPSIHLSPRTDDGRVGYHVISPFKTVGGEVILVNHGWIENGHEDYTLTTTKKIAGYLQSPDVPNTFTPPNNPKENLWYFVDFDAIGEFYNLPVTDKILYLESPIATSPKTFAGLPKPRNKHMQYAIFWFGMAGVLVVLVGVFYFKRD